MPIALTQARRSSSDKTTLFSLMLLLLIAAIAFSLGHWQALPEWRPGPLFWAIVLGIGLANLPRPGIGRQPEALWSEGFQRSQTWARGPVLRLGVILMGFQITVQDIQSLGLASLVLAAWMLISTLFLIIWLGRRLFKLDKPLVLLIAAGSAICGAAAVLAVSQVNRAKSEHIAVATATVVVFGSIAMFLYPVLSMLPGLTAEAYGLYVGATVHEVAQVIVAGDLVSAEASQAALITKLQRVLMLAPLLLILVFGPRNIGNNNATQQVVPEKPGRLQSVLQRMPWFALWFLAAVGIHSTGWLPDIVLNGLVLLGTVLLTVAMVAVGLCTRWRSVRAAGWRPMLLAGSGALYLIGGGYLATLLMTSL